MGGGVKEEEEGWRMGGGVKEEEEGDEEDKTKKYNKKCSFLISLKLHVINYNFA
jgi:hypothetical protein